MARPKKLKYQGTVTEIKGEHGKVIGHQPDRYFNGVPARDLDEEDLALLSDEDIKLIQGGDDPLYVDPEAEKVKKERAKQREEAKKEEAKKAKQSPPAKPEPTQETPTEPSPVVGPAPDMEHVVSEL